MEYQNIDDYRGDIKERLTRIETILNRELPDIKEQLKLSNGRMRSLENWRIIWLAVWQLFLSY